MPLDEDPQLDLIRQNGDDTPVTRIALPKRRHRRSPENGKYTRAAEMPPLSPFTVPNEIDTSLSKLARDFGPPRFFFCFRSILAPVLPLTSPIVSLLASCYPPVILLLASCYLACYFAVAAREGRSSKAIGNKRLFHRHIGQNVGIPPFIAVSREFPPPDHRRPKRGATPSCITKRRKGPIAPRAARAAPRTKSVGANRASNARLRPSTTAVRRAMSERRARS